MENFHFIYAIVGFFGGWCGSVPISLLIWWLIHHGPVPGPGPDPWPIKMGFIGGISGLVLTTILSGFIANTQIATADAVLMSAVTGILAGGVAGSFTPKSVAR